MTDNRPGPHESNAEVMLAIVLVGVSAAVVIFLIAAAVILTT